MSLGYRPFTRAFRGPAYTAVLVLLSAALAALAAHVGIDILGDYLLAHDTYDTIAHGSRTLMSGAVVAVFAGLLFAVFCSAVEQRRASGPGARPVVRSGRGPSDITAFFLLVVGITLGLLIAMEAGDLVLAGQSIADLDDLLGGSVWLAAAVTIPAALCSAFAVRKAAHWAATAQIAALRILDTILESRPRAGRGIRLSRRTHRRPFSRVMALSRSATRRGPPLRSE